MGLQTAGKRNMIRLQPSVVYNHIMPLPNKVGQEKKEICQPINKKQGDPAPKVTQTLNKKQDPRPTPTVLD